jgi:TP901 family phage tail tape measure protein
LNYIDTYSVEFKTKNAAAAATEFASALDRMNKAISSFDGNQLKQLNSSIDKLSTTRAEKLSAYAKGAKDLTAALTPLATRLNKTATAILEFAAAESMLTKGQRSILKNTLSNTYNDIGAKAQKAKKEIDNLTNAVEQDNRVQIIKTRTNKSLGNSYTRVSAQANSTAQAMQNVARSGKSAADEYLVSWTSVFRFFQANLMTRAVWSFSSALRDATKEAAELYKAVGEVQSISLDPSGRGPVRSAKAILADIRGISDRSGIVQADLVEAQYEAVSNQIQGAAESMQFLTEVTKFAKVAQTDAAHSVDLLSSAINSFGYETSRAGELGAKFFKAIEVGRFRAEEIANDFGRSAVLARQLGASMEELLGAFATTTIQGVKFANAQTFINNIMLKLTRPTDKMKQTLAELGVESGQAGIEIYGLVGLISELNKKANESLDPFGELGEMFGTIRAITGATTFIDPRTLAQYNKTLIELEDATRDYAAAFQTIMTNPGEIFLREMNKVKNVFTSDLGQAIVEFFAKMDGGVGVLSKNIIKFISIVGGVFAAFSFTKLVIGAIKSIIDLTSTASSQIAANTAQLTGNTAAQNANNLARAQSAATISAQNAALSVQNKALTSANMQTLLTSGAATGTAVAGGFLAKLGGARIILGKFAAALSAIISIVSAAGVAFLAYFSISKLVETQTYKTAQGFSVLAEEERKLSIASINLQTSYYGKLSGQTAFLIKNIAQARAKAIADQRKIFLEEGRQIDAQVDILDYAFRRINERYEAQLGVQDRLLKRFKFGIESLNTSTKNWGKQFRDTARGLISDFNKIAKAQENGQFRGPLPVRGLINQFGLGLAQNTIRGSQDLRIFLTRDVPEVQKMLGRLRREGFDQQWVDEQTGYLNEVVRGFYNIQQERARLQTAASRGLISPEDIITAQEQIEQASTELEQRAVKMSEDASLRIRDLVQANKQYADEIKRTFEAVDSYLREDDKDFSNPAVRRKLNQEIKSAANKFSNIQDLVGGDPKPMLLEELKRIYAEEQEAFTQTYAQAQKLNAEGKDITREKEELLTILQNIRATEADIYNLENGSTSLQNTLLGTLRERFRLSQRDYEARQESNRILNLEKELSEKVQAAQTAINDQNQLRGSVSESISQFLGFANKENLKEQGFTGFNPSTFQDANDILRSGLSSPEAVRSAAEIAAKEAIALRSRLTFSDTPANNPLLNKNAQKLVSLLEPLATEDSPAGRAAQQLLDLAKEFVTDREVRLNTTDLEKLLLSASGARAFLKTRSGQDTEITSTLKEAFKDPALAAAISNFVAERVLEEETFKKVKERGLTEVDAALTKIIRETGFQDVRGLADQSEVAAKALGNLNTLSNEGLNTLLKSAGITDINAEQARNILSGPDAEREAFLKRITESFGDPKIQLDTQFQELSGKLVDLRSTLEQTNNALVNLNNEIGKEEPSRFKNILASLGVDGKARGGVVGNRPNIRPMGTDSVLTALTPGEFVLNRQAVRNLGPEFLYMLNKGGIPRFQNGGYFSREDYIRALLLQEELAALEQKRLQQMLMSGSGNSNRVVLNPVQTQRIGFTRTSDVPSFQYDMSAYRRGPQGMGAGSISKNTLALNSLYQNRQAQLIAARKQRMTSPLLMRRMRQQQLMELRNNPLLRYQYQQQLQQQQYAQQYNASQYYAQQYEKLNSKKPDVEELKKEIARNGEEFAKNARAKKVLTKLPPEKKSLTETISDYVLGAAGANVGSFVGAVIGHNPKFGPNSTKKQLARYAASLPTGLSGPNAPTIATAGKKFSYGKSAAFTAGGGLLGTVAQALYNQSNNADMDWKKFGLDLLQGSVSTAVYTGGDYLAGKAYDYAKNIPYKALLSKSGAYAKGALGKALPYGRKALPYLNKAASLTSKGANAAILPAMMGMNIYNAGNLAQQYSGKKDVSLNERISAFFAKSGSDFLLDGQYVYDALRGQHATYGFENMSPFSKEYFDTLGLQATSMFGVGSGVSTGEAQLAYLEEMKRRALRRAEGGIIPGASLPDTHRPSLIVQGNGMGSGSVSMTNENNFNINSGADPEVLAYAVMNRMDTLSVRNQRQIKQTRSPQYQNRRRSY